MFRKLFTLTQAKERLATAPPLMEPPEDCYWNSLCRCGHGYNFHERGGRCRRCGPGAECKEFHVKGWTEL